ncbi:hypothetical protein F5Y15DRAFT_235649 [Xylariaceae sp. FL0016]|nr:hypothetical protein F5Y15DRAFT_235649 [Xylariaceae sp. FL0016]
MAATNAADDFSSASANENQNDPFLSPAPRAGPTHHRFSNFDSQLFALGPNASPAQAKKALEAHLAETDRRMEEAGKLGTALVQQRKELTERLRDVEKLKTEGELSEDLRQKLVEIEKDYNDVARESARAFLPKQRIPSNEAAPGSPFVPEGKGGRRSVSPSKFEAQATGSPTKFSVPNRKIRNQPANRVHDIEFAAEISTSLIAQVRNLQSLLSEREEELKDVKSERSKLEYDAEGFQHRLKSLDEREQRYKDENWNLETQIQQLQTKEREAADREKKLTHSFNLIQAEKNSAQRELDEVKLSHSKLTEEHAAAVKHHDIELGTAKRTMVMGESERAAMQRKIEDLTGQNTELAKAVSVSMRGRKLERESIFGMGEDDFQTAHENSTPEHSPPPSPVKGTPRHSMLESETLKTSLAHAQRTIQGLRNNVHREKTERMETRRLLQEARDEIEKLRVDTVGNTSRRAKKTDSREFKKPQRLLGGLRSVRSEIMADDANWEDHPEGTQVPSSPATARETSRIVDPVSEQSDHFETAAETSDAAFETANERETETDDFHTGAEEFSSDDVETETESPSKHATLRKRPSAMSGPSWGSSMDSTASTDDESFPFDHETRTHNFLPPFQQKFPLRVNRGAYRRSRQASEEPTLQSSPASFANSSQAGTPKPSQSLAAELGDFDGSDNDSTLSGTPSRRSIRAQTLTPPPPMPRLPRVIMVDSGMMTEPIAEPLPTSPATVIDRPMSMDSVANRFSIASSAYSDGGNLDEKLAKFPSPPTSPPIRDFALQPELVVSDVHSHVVEPLPEPDTHSAELAALRAEHAEQLKNISAESTAAHAAALEVLKSQHADSIAQSQAEVKLAHARELESLRSDHADATSRAAADAEAAHAREIEALKAAHTEQASKAVDGAKAAHAQELELLRSTHADATSKAAAVAAAAHAEEIEALKAAHAEQATKTTTEAQSTHAQELDALKAAHGQHLSEKESAIKARHAADIDRLKAAHANEIENRDTERNALHSNELEALRAKHSEQLALRESEIKATYAAELDNLKSTHDNDIAKRDSDSKAAFAADLDALRSKHAEDLSKSKADSDASRAAEIAAMVAAHASQINHSKQELASAHAAELDALKASHVEQVDQAKLSADSARSEELERHKLSHLQQIEETKKAINDSHAEELESLKATHTKQLGDLQAKNDAAHAAEIAALVGSHGKQIESHRSEGEATLSRELASLKEKHSQEIESLNSKHATAHAEELEGFKSALAKQVESSKTEGDAAHTQQIEALNAAHAEIVEAHKRDSEKSQAQALESLKSAHDRQIDSLKSEHAATRAREMEEISAGHLRALDALRTDNESSRAEIVNELGTTHAQELEELRKDSESSKEQALAALAAQHTGVLDALKVEHLETLERRLQEMAASHTQELEALRNDNEATKASELAALSATHLKDLEVLRAEHEATLERLHKDIRATHSQELEVLRQENEATKAAELAAVSASHAKDIDSLKGEHEAKLAQRMQELSDAHSQEREGLREENEATKSKDLAALAVEHENRLARLRSEHEDVRKGELEELKSTHVAALASLRTEHEQTLQDALEKLKMEHAGALDALKQNRDISQAEALEALGLSHSKQLDELKRENDVALARELDAMKTEHANILDSHKEESSAEKNQLLARHASELDTLRKTLTAPRPALGLSSLSSIETEPVEAPEPRSPWREAFIIPRDDPETPLRKKGKAAAVPFIAEDETRQSPSAARGPETPESQRPFREISTNTNARPPRKSAGDTTHQGAQTTLTSEGLDRLMRGLNPAVMPDNEPPSPSSVVRIRRPSQDSTGSVGRTRLRMIDTPVSAPSPIPPRRPGSAASGRGSFQELPPLPPNHREAIEAARSNSSHGGKGSMGPPLLSATALRNAASRPQTPGTKSPLSPGLAKGNTTPRAGRTPGYVDVHSPTRLPARSRQSSMSSFASEIDTRFNIRPDMAMEAAGFPSHTDPRMIMAITQTMIGEYLWKYTRKAGRGEMSEKRHRRYFWVHPYTRTLYWSDTDPGQGKSETKAKSIPIEAVRVVTDENPYPVGLHQKSLIIVSPGRSVKFTCTTGQRHETWFNALSYLLLRTGNENQADTEEMAGNITQDDVDEFNPGYSQPPVSGNRPRAPPSLSSYNSRTTRNESPAFDMSIPTLTRTQDKETPRNSTLGRLSGMLRTTSAMSGFGSLRTRSHTPQDNAIYEASEVNDSAEDLRQMYEQQDREADRLENVRACCDGKRIHTYLP